MSITLHINTLPDLVLRRVFSKVPLRDMISIGRVCPLWRSYQVKIGKQVRSLTLLIGSPLSMITKSSLTLKYRDLLLNDDSTRMYSSQHLPKHFHLAFGSFPLDGAAQVLNIFPHITTLEVAIKFAQIELDSLITLLINWSPTLKSLKMYFRPIETPARRSIMLVLVETKEGKIVNLLKVINSLSSLEHLTLDYHGALFSKSPCDLSILGQLREFYLDSLDHHNSIVKSLEKYAVKNENLQQIALNMWTGTLPTFYHKFSQLKNKVVFLSTERLTHIGNLLYRIKNLAQDILPFNSITLLRLEPDRDENIFTGALNFLASLKQLVHLEISFNSGYFASLQAQNQHQVSRDQIVQLSSIQVLILSDLHHEYLNFAYKCESQVNNWAHLFPNVQVIELISFFSIHDLTLEAKIRKSLTTFVHCLKLCYLYTLELGFEDERSRYREWIVVQFRGRRIVCGDIIGGPVH